MSTVLSQLPRETCAILPADHNLLRAALKDWYDQTAFTDEHVSQVKCDAFQRWLVETAWSKLHCMTAD